ncbi:MAG: hypothetical protein IJ824_00850 [Alphaproteobacteria bacterium]|nr:hypothetical protein [Alphaproteobacteria bacterium]
MDMQKLEKSADSLSRLSQVVEELINVVHQQRQNFAADMEKERNNVAAAQEKTATLEAQVQSLNAEKEKLLAELSVAQNNTEAEDKIKELQSVADSRSNKINGLQTEVQNLNTALNNRKMQLEENERKNVELTQELDEAKAKISELENAQASGNSAAAELRQQLDAV